MRPPTTTKICPKCNTEFQCSKKCWCYDYPPILPITNAGCSCQNCLHNEVQEKIEEYLTDLTPSKIKSIQKLGVPSKFIEGIDYNLNEKGHWVFTSWFLLRQGKCCNNNCKNCPYPKKSKHMIYYISGGERSGKSGYAQNLATELSDKPIYLATSRVWDGDFEKRVQRHISDRDERWTTIEEEKYLSNHNFEGGTVVIDCVTLWLTNWYVDTKNNVEESLNLAKEELIKLFKQKANFIIISNEIGMGIHAQTEVGRKFTELQGWMNQFIAKQADEAVFMVSGLPMKLKSNDA